METETTLALQANNNAGDIIVGAIDRISFRHGKAFTGLCRRPLKLC
jgi:hypothetical protein